MSDWTAGAEYSRKALESARAFVAAEPEDLWLRKKLAIDYDQLGAGARMLRATSTAPRPTTSSRWRCAGRTWPPSRGDVENRRNVAVSYR